MQTDRRAVSRMVAALGLLFVAASVRGADSLNIKFEGPVVSARITPGARSVWFSIVHESVLRGTVLVPRTVIVADDDRDGVVRLTLDAPPPGSSFWMVADLASGEYAIESPRGEPRRRKIPPAALQLRGNGKPAQMLHRHSWLMVCVVRPGTGAWFGRIEDGSSADGDGAMNGNVAALLAKLSPVGGSPAPPEDFVRGDIVVLADPSTLAVLDGQVVR